MANSEMPAWLKGLPLAPEYRPTETEFADPIAFISRIEREAATFGICKVIPPLPKPSKKFVLANLNRCLSKSPELGPSAAATGRGDAAVFTTRHQELGSPRNRLSVHKQVWQSGEVYTLEQFEVKSKAFAKTQLAGFKEVSPLLVESLFWKAAADKPIYVEYANDVPGSGFGVPEEPFRCYSHRRRRNRGFNKEVVQEPKRPCPKAAGESSERDNTGTGSAGWKLSNSPWNLQVIARSPGSLTRFMPDEVPGVTSPMVYIGMLFSWFAWHVEDHELHSLNFLHMGAPKTWYAVPGEYAATVEEIVRSQGYGGNVDRMASLAMLGEKTTLLSPEILVASGVPCCRLVQNPGEFVVTFPRAYHVGFSHGFNCGEAANFATPQWLKVAKEAAVRRAAMNYLPMLSHQQLLYMLTMSFISRVPRELLSDVRSSRLRDRKKEEREILVKRAFLDDMLNENNLVCVLLGKESTSGAVLWEPEFLPPPCVGPQSNCSFLSLEAHEPTVEDDHKREMNPCQLKGKDSVDGKSGDCFVENVFDVVASVSTVPSHCESSMETHKNACHVSCMSSQVKSVDSIDVDEDDLPFGLNIDSGSLACVACGILGYPFMAILQPSEKALKELFPVNCEESHDKLTNSQCLNQNPLLPGTLKKFNSGLKECGITSKEQQNPHLSSNSSFEQGSYGQSDTRDPSSHCAKVPDVIHEQASTTNSSHQTGPDNPSTVSSLSNNSVNGTEHGHPMSVADHPDDELDPQNEDSLCGSSNNTKFYHSNALHSCNVMKESGRDALMKTKAIDENVLCSTGFSHRKSLNETDRPCGVPMGKCHSDFLDWNTSNGFQRPRIFCMQHALEIEELLRCKGGARVLIICHSDYLKIKALAISIAEEIDFQFDCKDVPLENASQSDLNLINISIDDEDHDEDGNDWTAKLGLNLKYCAKIRKQSSVNQEKLVLSLGGIFSDPVSVISNLRWLSRKSRTPYKVTGAIQSKSYVSAKNDTNKSLIVKSNVNLPKEIQVYHSRKSKPSRMGAKHLGRPRKATYKEESSYGGTAMADKDDDKTGYDQNHRWSKKVGDVDTDNLLTVPVLVAEYPPMRQDNFAMQRICTSHELVDFAKSSELPVPVNSTVGSCARQPEMHLNELKSTIPICDPKSECCLPYFNVPLVECSALRQRIAEEFSSGCKFGSSETSELQAVVTQEGECATIHRVERVMDETNSEQELNDSVKPVCVPTIRTAKNNEDMQETLMVPLPNSGDNLASEKSELGNTVGESLRSESHPRANNASMQGHLDERKFTVENLVVNNCEAQQPLTDEAIMDSEVGDSLRSECQFVTLNPVMDDSVNSLGPDTMLVDESSIVPDAIENSKEASGTVDIYYSNGVERTKEKPARVILIPYVRRRNKRTREAEEEKKSDSDNCCNSFIRSPCEGLRPRNGQMIVASSDVSIVEKKVMAKAKKRRENSDLQRGKERFKESFKCDVEGCDMNFGTRGELSLHKRNRCTHEGCGKRFSSHKYAMRHQCVHNDERPLKCPWKGCNMSFKWAWARTEHVRVHTGERPYKCKVSGCGQTFRFVSDFSRHRRKTGHSVNPTSR